MKYMNKMMFFDFGLLDIWSNKERESRGRETKEKQEKIKGEKEGYRAYTPKIFFLTENCEAKNLGRIKTHDIESAKVG